MEPKQCGVARKDGSGTTAVGFRHFSGRVSVWMTSRAACLGWLVIVCVLTAIGNAVLGAAILLAGILILLVISDDVLTTTLPFLLLSVFVLPNYDSYELFIPYWWLVFPALLALLFHFVYYHRPWRYGRTFFGVIGVAVAVTLAGAFSEAEFSPTVLFYSVTLGVGMVITYLLLSSDLGGERRYDVAKVFSRIMISTGVYATILLMSLWISGLSANGFSEMTLQPSNNLGTFLLFAVPFPLYLLGQSRGKARLGYFLLFLLLVAALLFSGSRGAIVIAPVLILISLILYAIVDVPRRRLWGALAVVSVLLLSGATALALQFLNPESAEAVARNDLSRLRLIRASMLDFLEYPVFGVGLAGSRNTSAYQPVTGAMRWYHMMLPQIIGSMGACGVVAYAFQIYTRIRTYLSRISPYTSTLLLSYFGVLLMSQVNPGEFCPIPYELLTVMLFVLMEREPRNDGENTELQVLGEDGYEARI